MQFDEDWADDARHREPSAREREQQARRRRWAEEDRRELQGTGDATRRAKRERRQHRWRRTWPWLVFFAVAAVLIGGSRLLGL